MKRFIFLLAIIVSAVATSNAEDRKFYDAMAFELVDHPKYVITHEGMIVFNEDGSLNKEKSTALNGFKKYTIVRDSNGYPVEVQTDDETITFKFDNQFITERHVDGAENYSEYYQRNDGFKPESTYIQTITTETFTGTRSKKASEQFYYFCDSRGNWNYIKTHIDLFSNDESINDYADYRIIVYHKPKYKYNTGNESEITFFDLLNKPFGLENGHEILNSPLKEIKKNLKANKIKCSGTGMMENNTMTFYGYNFSASYVFYAHRDKTKAQRYEAGKIYTKGDALEDIFGFCISELIENGTTVYAVILEHGYKRCSLVARFYFNDYPRQIKNNTTEVVTLY